MRCARGPACDGRDGRGKGCVSGWVSGCWGTGEASVKLQASNLGDKEDGE